MNYNETIVFVIRQTGWSLEYVRQIPIDELNALVEEMAYQQAMEDYRQALSFASVIATMVSLWSKRKMKAKDIVGRPPQRQQKKKEDDEIWKIARQHGIQIPTIRT